MARHIAKSAARLFAQQGYDATSVREIVEAAGVAKPTLYYYFRSKEGLAQALLTRPMTALIAETRAILDRDGDPVEALAGLLEANFAFCREDPDRARLMYALFFGPLATSLAAEITGYSDELNALLERGVDRLVAAGLVDKGRAGALGAAVHGLVTIYTCEYLYRNKELPSGQARGLVDDLLRGFGNPERAAATQPEPCTRNVHVDAP